MIATLNPIMIKFHEAAHHKGLRFEPSIATYLLLQHLWTEMKGLLVCQYKLLTKRKRIPPSTKTFSITCLLAMTKKGDLMSAILKQTLVPWYKESMPNEKKSQNDGKAEIQ